MPEDEVDRQHHQLNGCEFEQAPGDEGEESQVCCSPWGCKELDTERLNNNNICNICSYCCHWNQNRLTDKNV